MNNRINLIREIIRARKVRSQEELAGLLAARGVKATQATLSRDLKKLQIVKYHDNAGGHYYVLPEAERPAQNILLSDSLAGDSIVSIEFSGQMGVIKTLPGCANMVGALVDGHSHPALMGTVAGENTLLLVLREGFPHAEFLAFLEGFLPSAGARVIDNTN
ncbi:MAG: ArgR family transcriptional regulator [Bacteroidales bacterium]|nr:ArgR family transcriptional regulator [Bacteroidales bacterium]